MTVHDTVLRPSPSRLPSPAADIRLRFPGSAQHFADTRRVASTSIAAQMRHRESPPTDASGEARLSDPDVEVDVYALDDPGNPLAYDGVVLACPRYRCSSSRASVPIESEQSKTLFHRLMIAQGQSDWRDFRAVRRKRFLDLPGFAPARTPRKGLGSLRTTCSSSVARWCRKASISVARGQRKLSGPRDRPSARIAKPFPQTDPLPAAPRGRKGRAPMCRFPGDFPGRTGGRRKRRHLKRCRLPRSRWAAGCRLPPDAASVAKLAAYARSPCRAGAALRGKG